MNQQQFDAFLLRAKDAWERMEIYRQAYASDADNFEKKSDRLKWATIGIGFLTGVCSIPVFLEIAGTEYLIAIFGVVTGSLTLVDKHFRWNELSTETWKNQKALDGLQRDLYNFCVDAGHSSLTDDPSLFIQQILDKAEKFTSIRISNTEHWGKRAKEVLKSHRISQITYTSAANQPEEIEEYPTEDAVGITAVIRG